MGEIKSAYIRYAPPKIYLLFNSVSGYYTY